MRIAGLWSLDPTAIDDHAVAGDGLFGHLTSKRLDTIDVLQLRPPTPPAPTEDA